VDRGPPDIRNPKICCGFSQTGFHSSERRQCFGSCMRCVSNPRPVMYATSSNLFVSCSYVIDSDTLSRFYRTLRFSKQPSCFCAGGSGFECGEIGYADWGSPLPPMISSVPPDKCSETFLKRNSGGKLSLAELSEVGTTVGVSVMVDRWPASRCGHLYAEVSRVWIGSGDITSYLDLCVTDSEYVTRQTELLFRTRS